MNWDFLNIRIFSALKERDMAKLRLMQVVSTILGLLVAAGILITSGIHPAAIFFTLLSLSIGSLFGGYFTAIIEMREEETKEDRGQERGC